MKNSKKMFTAISVLCLMSGMAMANPETNTQFYAHPTMFGAVAQETIDANKIEIVGGESIKSENRLTVKGKENVAISSLAKDILATIKENTTEKVWNPKMPILRSELAVVLAEGLDLKNTSNARFTDTPNNYWAKKWIDKVNAKKIMIGYPDRSFRPDQPITKAEVFSTIATLIQVPVDRSLLVPEFAGMQMQYIPRWAIAPTKEMVNSKLLDEMPCPKAVAENEYLSKEQVAYLVASLRQSFIFNNQNGTCANFYTPTIIKVKLDERLSSKTSNAGDVFTSKTTEDVVIGGKTIAKGATIKGEVVEVIRPGFKKSGYIKVKFTEIQSGECCIEFPKNISEAYAPKLKNPNFVARLFGAPFSAAGRILGVAGRTISSAATVASNSVETIGDDFSNTFVNTLSSEHKAGAKSFGKAFVTVGKGVYNIVKLAGSGVFGIVYELCDEAVYLVAPCSSNNSSLNPSEEITIIY